MSDTLITIRENTVERTGFEKTAADFEDVLKNIPNNVFCIITSRTVYAWERNRPTRLPVSGKAIKLMKLLRRK